MTLLKSFEYKGKRVDIYQKDIENVRFDNTVYEIHVDGYAVSEDHSMPGPTLDLVMDDVKHWIDGSTLI